MGEANYKVSVITPSHNTNLALMQKAFDSLKAQTCGFEQIEWIIVVHNDPDEKFAAVEEMVKGCENVRLYRLNNDNRTASSPRNYGIPKATGKYLSFLDNDDTLTPTVFATVIPKLEESDAEIGIFRYEAISDSNTMNAICPYVLVNQTREFMVEDTDTWDSSNYVYGAGMNVTSKVYLRAFIEKNGFSFDEEVPLAEDNLFNLHCYSTAKKICFFPQLIGYEYNLNNGSLVQSFKKSAADALRYAVGIKKVIEYGLTTGLYMNYVICDLLGFESAVMLASMDLPLETRLQISELLAPYLSVVRDLKPSKLHSRQMANTIIKLPKLTIGQPKFCYYLLRLLNRLGVDTNKRIAGMK